MSLSRSLPPLSLALALAMASTVAWAKPKPHPQPPPPQPQRQRPQQAPPHAQQDQQGLSESVRRAERSGQVLSAEQVQYDGRDVNRVKIVDDKGRVRVYWDDPATQGQGQQQQTQQRSQGKRNGKPPQGGRTRSDDDGDPNL
ncbi:hypothetical protein LVB87_03010 [Lysobacter sp. KIS68-7]|uniref:hypothetical protein n=1 Tax=Lysobacter sp. KIS68-7 TaxID=2904252 RepID=UPI001E2F7E66|nr:hypothetical protein [Lysobacter sp. KIS68-7]UHQ20145.1 hypothetical protein LVB87_03010 [Lysobacter sp. KIS68-7]